MVAERSFVEARARQRNNGGGTDMDELRRRLDGQDRALEQVRNDQSTMILAVQRVEKSIADILTAVGMEKEDGQGGYSGTGLLGRARRTEIRQDKLERLYRQWIAYGAGFVSCFTVIAGVVWWLIGDKIELVLKGSGHG